MLFAKGLLFDLDGTLAESFPDIAHAVNLTLKELGRNEAPEEKIRHWVGNGSPTLMKRALTGEMDGEPDAELFSQAMPQFFENYAEYAWHKSFLYEGVIETLDHFRSAGFAMACVTNKPARHTALVLEQSGLGQYFSCFVGGDSLATRKPDPEPLYHAAREINADPSQCVMVGDSLSDILAAKSAAMPVLCLTYGYNQGLDLGSYDPDQMVDHFADLTSLVGYATE